MQGSVWPRACLPRIVGAAAAAVVDLGSSEEDGESANATGFGILCRAHDIGNLLRHFFFDKTEEVVVAASRQCAN